MDRGFLATGYIAARAGRLFTSRPPSARLQRHVEPDDGPVLVGVQFDPIAHLVHEPEAVPSRRVGWRRLTAHRRVSNDAPVADLADNLGRVGPDLHRPGRMGVPDGVRGDLADGDHEVDDTCIGQAGFPGLSFRQGAYLRQVIAVKEGHVRLSPRVDRFPGQIIAVLATHVLPSLPGGKRFITYATKAAAAG